AWCLLQIMAFDVIEDAGIAHFCVPKNEPLLDRDLLLLIPPLLSTEGSEALATLIQQAQNWEDLERLTVVSQNLCANLSPMACENSGGSGSEPSDRAVGSAPVNGH